VSRLLIEHTTRFAYQGSVSASYNEARMTPRHEPGRQHLLHSGIDIAPVTWRHDYVDYWGTRVTAFEVLSAHTELEIIAKALVEVTARPHGGAGVGWEDVRAATVTDELAEYLSDSPTTAPPPDVAAIAERAAREHPPHEAARVICAGLGEEVAYVPGATAVHSTAAEAWDVRQGVCQDMAHLSVGALRAVGIPARYVSGYLHPESSGPIGEPAAGESHAWVEWWAGGWSGFDPTNRSEVTEHHVVLARGREYQDVAPLRGIFAGPGTQALDVRVSITREA